MGKTLRPQTQQKPKELEPLNPKAQNRIEPSKQPVKDSSKERPDGYRNPLSI